MSTPLEALAEFAARTGPDDLPAAVRESIRERILDTLGICLAASRLETSGMARRVARELGGGGNCTAPAFGDRLNPAAAGFLGGTLAHSLDYDDTHLPSVLHPSASIIPAVLALGEALGATVDDVLPAAAVAYEVCIRTGMAAYDVELGNSVFFERGWHATSICGTLAVAVAAAKLLGLGAEGIGHALGIAASMGAGIIEGNRAGGSVKRLHCGWAAHAGIVAAQCARAGLTGPRSALEGRFGFYNAFCGGFLREEELRDGLGREWSIPDIFYKPYPANHFTHAGIDAALSLRGEIEIDRIRSIRLGVAAPTLRTIAEPREKKIRPESGYHAQFSGPFTVAAALLGGGGLGLALDDFSDEKARDPRYLELAGKVECFADEECGALFPRQFPAVLCVRLESGEQIERRVMHNRGGPDNPLERHELETKFFDNASRVLERERASAVAELLFDGRGARIAELVGGTKVPAV